MVYHNLKVECLRNTAYAAARQRKIIQNRSLKLIRHWTRDVLSLCHFRCCGARTMFANSILKG